MTLAHLSAAIAEEPELCESRIRALIDHSISLSEEEVLAAAENITDMNRDAQEHVVALDGLHAQFHDVPGGATLSSALEQQRRTMGAYVAAMDRGLTEQHDGATRAGGCAKEITISRARSTRSRARSR